jgi:hypothetical protein
MKHKVFKTSDIILAACLQVHNYPLISIELSDTKGTFVFNDIDDSVSLNTQYNALHKVNKYIVRTQS